MNNSTVRATHLTVCRGGKPVLRDLSLEVAAGAITALVGPSGCGKSTLMRTLVGLQAVTGGSVSVLGAPAGSASLRARVGYAPQGTSVYPDLTVAENVRYFAVCVGAPRDEAERVIEQVDLTPYGGQLAGALSGGQRSRVSLAVALLGQPDLLILDEPTVGLDPVLREQLWQLFAVQAGGGITVLVSSHVMDEAERCQDVLLMRDGRLLAQASPSSLKEQTATDNLDAAFLRLVSDLEAAA